VSLTASPGYMVAVEGPNGSGKTTLLGGCRAAARRQRERPTGSVGHSPERALLPIWLHKIHRYHIIHFRDN